MPRLSRAPSAPAYAILLATDQRMLHAYGPYPDASTAQSAPGLSTDTPGIADARALALTTACASVSATLRKASPRGIFVLSGPFTDPTEQTTVIHRPWVSLVITGSTLRRAILVGPFDSPPGTTTPAWVLEGHLLTLQPPPAPRPRNENG